jgi:hypothetical protein
MEKNQTVYIKEGKSIFESKITKIGKKFFYLDGRFRHYKISIQTLTDSCNYGHGFNVQVFFNKP